MVTAATAKAVAMREENRVAMALLVGWEVAMGAAVADLELDGVAVQVVVAATALRAVVVGAVPQKTAQLLYAQVA